MLNVCKGHALPEKRVFHIKIDAMFIPLNRDVLGNFKELKVVECNIKIKFERCNYT